MLVTGVGSCIGLTLIGVPFALPLGIFAFLTEAIPIAGPVIAGVVDDRRGVHAVAGRRRC